MTPPEPSEVEAQWKNVTALCKKCNKVIGWTGCNWIHREQPVTHIAVPRDETINIPPRQSRVVGRV